MPSYASLLEVSAADRACLLPLSAVAEVFRPLPVKALGEAVPGVAGLVRVRGEALPVVELNPLLGLPAAPAGRFIRLRLGGRGAVLAVDGVPGIRALEDGRFEALPALLAADAPAVEAVSVRDNELLLLLRQGRLLPPAAAGAGPA